MHRELLRLAALVCCLWCSIAWGQKAEPWRTAYAGEDASGGHVIAFWNFDEAGDSVADASGKNHAGVMEGVVRRSDGRFGGGVESFAGWPVEDVRHGIQVPNAPELSPRGAFSVEMWICPHAALTGYEEVFLVDKKYVEHTDYQWVLESEDGAGKRNMRVALGFGADSELWWSKEPVSFRPDTWVHIAFTYDGAGTVEFFLNSQSLGRTTKTGRGSVLPGNHALSLGDRIGSLYHGFPGRMDEIRISEGVREFRPVMLAAEHGRNAFLRMEPAPVLRFRMTNIGRETLSALGATAGIEGVSEQAVEVPELAPEASHVFEYALDTTLRPDRYEAVVTYRLGAGADEEVNRQTFPIDIVPRKPPNRMPVVMWGIGGVESVLESMEPLKDIGFTHCLGLRCDYQRIWDAKAPVSAVSEVELAGSRRMLDQALVHDLGIIISLGLGHWLEGKPELLRVDRSGNPYERGNICCNFPELTGFAHNVGAAVARTYGDFPAFEAALINTEVRDGSQLCFHEHDRNLYRASTGKDIPEAVTGKNGVSFSTLEGFPANRVIPEDQDLLHFYRWFWREGDGWNGFHSAVNNGLKSTERKGLWSFFDPAVRVPALWGSGGNADFLSHWTYSYPDPIRIGLAADELFAMAKGGPEGQDVMKMTQIIWYRSQTAPPAESGAQALPSSPWEDHDPGAAYITIAPAHLREAFWTKISRPVKGIMYHGWQSLIQTEGGSSYRYTHPETRHALKDLVSTVIRPLGPTLVQVPAARTDVAFLESFTSAMFAGRGTYGWGGSWGGDAYHILLYARLQPEIVYEETIMKTGLDGYRVLVLADCDVLPAQIVDRIHAFQQAGGVLVGDGRLCPGVKPDLLLDVYARTGQADVDKGALLARARVLRDQLGPVYQPYVDSSSEEVLPYRRAYGASEYIFAINDSREFGEYVGRHRLVMENGLPANARFTINRPAGFVYDLVDHRETAVERDGNALRIPVELEPGGGKMLLVTEKPIDRIGIEAAAEARRSESLLVNIIVADDTGTPLDAVIPVEVDIRDPDGRIAERSGYYGAKDGQLQLSLAMAPNDIPGVWTLTVRELASGKAARHYFRLGV